MSKTTDGKAPKAGTGSAPPKRRDGTSIEIGGQLFEGLPEGLVTAIEGMQAKLAEHESMGDAKPEDRPMDSSEVSRLRSELDRSRGRLEVLEQRERERADAEKARELDSLRARAERVAGCKLDGADDLEVLRGAIKAVDKSANVDGLSRDRLLGRFEALEQTGHRDQALSILTIVRSGEADRGDSLGKANERRQAKINEMKKGA
jgi:hypothetical protein